VRRAGAAATGENGAADGTQARRQALAVLLARYQPALKSYLCVVRRLGDDADDLLQAFVADKLLERDMLRHADEGRGKFRTFLLTSLNNFVTSWYRAAGNRVRAARRLEDVSDHRSNDASPAAEVEAAWARALVRDVVAAMREKCRADGREDVWLVFEGRVLAEVFEDKQPVPYEKLAEQLGLRSPMQAANLLVTAKRLYSRLLRVAVSEYERNESHIEEEIADLRASLAKQNRC
jgi:DNA-directed RNA polymerase specialized sigma24 family protein